MVTTNTIIDLSHHNPPVEFVKAKAYGIAGVIHKATQGLHYRDSMYRPRLASASQLGLLWGAYHFGEGSDGKAQAQHFIDAVTPDDSTLLVLDFEENTIGESMTLGQAYDFISKVQLATGRYPVIYGGSYLKQLLNGKPDAILSNCPLWIADYRSTPEIPNGWDYWSLWQYTDGRNGNQPHEVPGIGPCDRDIFNGSLEQLKTFWLGQQ